MMFYEHSCLVQRACNVTNKQKYIHVTNNKKLSQKYRQYKCSVLQQTQQTRFGALKATRVKGRFFSAITDHPH